MKTLLFVLTSAVAVLAFSSCECSCNSYNPALLRDVPVKSSRSFE